MRPISNIAGFYATFGLNSNMNYRDTHCVNTPSVVLLPALNPFIDVLPSPVLWQAGMYNLSGATLRRPDQITVWATLGIFNNCLLMLVIGENIRIDLDAFPTGCALLGVYPWRHIFTC